MAKRQKLVGIQFLRAFASISVVFFHILQQLADNLDGYAILSQFDFGARGVSLFFVLSGFIIYTVHRREAGDPSALGPFIYKRAARILPFTFIAATAWVGLVFLAARVGIYAPGGTFQSWLSSAFVLPFDRPYPGVIWSLRNELIFYIFFAFIFIWPKFFWIVFSSWISACIFIQTGDPFDAVTTLEIVSWTFFSSANILFALGVGAAFLHESVRRGNNDNIYFYLSFLVLFVACFLFRNLSYEFPGVMIFGLFSAVAVFFSARATTRWPLGERLGDASFSIYLVHPLILPVAFIFFSKLTDSFALLFIMESILLISSGFFVYQFVELPIMNLLKKRPFYFRISP